MLIIRNDQIVEFDVDGTLILWNHPGSNEWLNGVPFKRHLAHIESIKRFHARNQYIIVWSDGGWEWAFYAVKLLGLEDYVDEVRSKSKWHFDDKPHSEWNTVRCYDELKPLTLIKK
jgi:FMN phosphatase YigB (HAD superfamily)